MSIYDIIDYGGWSADSTTYQMIMVAKLTSIAYAFQDGTCGEMLTEWQERHKLTTPPAIFDLMGYMTMPMACVLGPFFEYRDFLDFVHERGDYIAPPFPKLPALLKSGLVVLTLAAYLWSSAIFPVEWFQSQDFYDTSFFLRCVYTLLGAIGLRTKYYVAFSFGDVSMHVCGMSYNGYKEVVNESGKWTYEYKYDRVYSIDMLGVEGAWSSKEMWEVRPLTVELESYDWAVAQTLRLWTNIEEV